MDSGLSSSEGPTFFFKFFINLKITKHSTLSSSSLIIKILIEPNIWWKSNWWKSPTTRAMGGSASSEVATGTEGIKKQAQMNIGLLTLASESQGFNMIEIATCIIAVIISLYLLRWCCLKHQAKKMDRLRATLRAVHVEPHVARLPVLHHPPPPPPPPPAHHLPAYPGLPKQSEMMQAMGAEIMAQYNA